MWWSINKFVCLSSNSNSESVQGAETTAANCQDVVDDVARQKRQLAKRHEQEMADARAKWEAQCLAAATKYNQEMAELDNRGKQAVLNVENSTKYVDDFRALVAAAKRKAVLASSMLWNRRNMPYAHATLDSIIDDLELSGGEAVVANLNKDQCRGNYTVGFILSRKTQLDMGVAPWYYY